VRRALAWVLVTVLMIVGTVTLALIVLVALPEVT